MKSFLCSLVIVLAFLVAVLATWFVLSNMHEPAARADAEEVSCVGNEFVRCDAQDGAKTRCRCEPSSWVDPGDVIIHVPKRDAGAPDAEPTVISYTPSSTTTWREVQIVPPKPAPHLWIDVTQDGTDLIVKWGMEKPDHAVSLFSVNKLRRDVERLKREVRELRKGRDAK